MKIRLDDCYRASLSVCAIDRILRLDRIWTSHLERNAVVSDTDRLTINAIVGDIVSGLEKLPHEIDWFDKLVGTDPDGFRAALERALSILPFNEKTQGALREHFVVGLITNRSRNTQNFSKLMADERLTMETKIKDLNSGASIDGDLSHSAECALAGFAFGLGSVAMLAAEPVGALAIGPTIGAGIYAASCLG